MKKRNVSIIRKTYESLRFLYFYLVIYQKINRREVLFYTNISLKVKKNINFAVDNKLN